jgi:hypothetical protein
MLGVPCSDTPEAVDSVDGDPQSRQQTFSPLAGHKQAVFPVTHTPTTSTILFFQ